MYSEMQLGRIFETALARHPRAAQLRQAEEMEYAMARHYGVAGMYDGIRNGWEDLVNGLLERLAPRLGCTPSALYHAWEAYTHSYCPR